MFVKALKTGKHMATSRDILPPMPWNWYSQLSEDDLKAIFAYLRRFQRSPTTCRIRFRLSSRWQRRNDHRTQSTLQN